MPQSDHFLATWDLVPELSLYETGSPPTGGRYTITESAPGVLTLHVRWQAEAGGPSRETVFGGPADGSPQPLRLAADAPAGTPEALTLTRVDARTLDSTVIAQGAVIASARRVASRDGALLAVVQEHADGRARGARNFQIYRRVAAVPDASACPQENSS